MLVFTRKIGQAFFVGEAKVMLLDRKSDGSIKVGVEAPREVPVLREEVADKQTK